MMDAVIYPSGEFVRSRNLIATVLVAALAATSCLGGTLVADPSPGETMPSNIGLAATQTGVAYGFDGLQRGDVYLPSNGENKGTIVVVMGGGFTLDGRADAAQWFGPLLAQTRRGYGVYLVAHRLTSGHTNLYPAALNDVADAIRWVRAHGSLVGLNGDKVMVAGGSSGAILSTLIGVGANSAPPAPPVPAVDGWISVGGVYDLADPKVFSLRVAWLGPNAGNQPVVAAASASQQCDRDDAPGYLAHGDLDHQAPIAQIDSMRIRATLVGCDVTIDIVDTGGSENWYGNTVSCRWHLPFCGMNIPALNQWIDTQMA